MLIHCVVLRKSRPHAHDSAKTTLPFETNMLCTWSICVSSGVDICRDTLFLEAFFLYYARQNDQKHVVFFRQTTVQKPNEMLLPEMLLLHDGFSTPDTRNFQ